MIPPDIFAAQQHARPIKYRTLPAWLADGVVSERELA
jgi:hypothetical protein